MTTMTVYYDREPLTVVRSVAELDDLLDRIANTPKYTEFPVFVSIETDDRRYVLQLGLGRPDLSTLVWYEAEVDIMASTGTVGYTERPKFNFGGTPTDAYDHSAIPVQTARTAAREFFTSSARPACVEWQEPQFSPEGEVAAQPT
jgi:hypothetical protein